jgi:hypothetical protein
MEPSKFEIKYAPKADRRRYQRKDVYTLQDYPVSEFREDCVSSSQLLANSYLMRHQTRVAKFANTLKGNLK